MKGDNMKIRSWLYILSVSLAFLGAVIALVGAISFFQAQTQSPGDSVWPLPGLALVDWVAFSVLGFLGVWFSNKSDNTASLNGAWLAVGALAPLVILGAFSIGLFVLITELLLLIASIIVTFRRSNSNYRPIGLAMVGVIGNLGLFFMFLLAGSLI
jgi:hypothetical protein